MMKTKMTTLPNISGANTLQWPVLGRRIQIAGSANGKTNIDLIRYAHEIVRALTKSIISAGGGIVVGAGKEPRPDNSSPNVPSLLFDWTALEAVAESLQQNQTIWPLKLGLPIVVILSEKSESEIPDDRRQLYNTLVKSGQVRFEGIMPGARAAVFVRERQATFGDALVILGGGTGVEHLANLYLSRRKPVIPLDLALGASRDDGTGGASRLAKEARAEPGRFFRFNPTFANMEGTALASIVTRDGNVPATEVVANILDILAKLAQPTAFYVRLLNQDHPKFTAVESFFRNVVDSVVAETGMVRVEMGTDKSEHPFMNVAIFDNLHYSSVAIVDITGERPNCFIELGYALGNHNRVLVTAEKGTTLPFDQEAIPCHFWKPSGPLTKRKEAFVEFWKNNINRPPIIKAE